MWFIQVLFGTPRRAICTGIIILVASGIETIAPGMVTGTLQRGVIAILTGLVAGMWPLVQAILPILVVLAGIRILVGKK